mmetsp:Transcript_42416/g.83337  ORF Transcript_42416/g.83337 Transcript_42416/m.83337 type:complete len:232 (+) Transcript_42416:129-824(+)
MCPSDRRRIIFPSLHKGRAADSPFPSIYSQNKMKNLAIRRVIFPSIHKESYSGDNKLVPPLDASSHDALSAPRNIPPCRSVPLKTSSLPALHPQNSCPDAVNNFGFFPVSMKRSASADNVAMDEKIRGGAFTRGGSICPRCNQSRLSPLQRPRAEGGNRKVAIDSHVCTTEISPDGLDVDSKWYTPTEIGTFKMDLVNLLQKNFSSRDLEMHDPRILLSFLDEAKTCYDVE